MSRTAPSASARRKRKSRGNHECHEFTRMGKIRRKRGGSSSTPTGWHSSAPGNARGEPQTTPSRSLKGCHIFLQEPLSFERLMKTTRKLMWHFLGGRPARVAIGAAMALLVVILVGYGSSYIGMRRTVKALEGKIPSLFKGPLYINDKPSQPGMPSIDRHARRDGIFYPKFYINGKVSRFPFVFYIHHLSVSEPRQYDANEWTDTYLSILGVPFHIKNDLPTGPY